jgi:glycine cleavage system H protein
MQSNSTTKPPADRRYLATHEWHKLDGDIVTLGITQFAADELTDITFVSMPKIGEKLSAGKRFGEIESVKATSDLYCGVAGAVTETNTELNSSPGLINSDPYHKGWIMKVKVASPDDFNKLLSLEDYLKQIGK